eukprot:4298035-Prymnesium_polylepis.1
MKLLEHCLDLQLAEGACPSMQPFHAFMYPIHLCAGRTRTTCPIHSVWACIHRGGSRPCARPAHANYVFRIAGTRATAVQTHPPVWAPDPCMGLHHPDRRMAVCIRPSFTHAIPASHVVVAQVKSAAPRAGLRPARSRDRSHLRRARVRPPAARCLPRCGGGRPEAARRLRLIRLLQPSAAAWHSNRQPTVSQWRPI